MEFDARRIEAPQKLSINIGNRVTEAVKINDFAFDSVSPPPGYRPREAEKVLCNRAKFLNGKPARQVSCNGRKNIAAMESVAYGRQEPALIFQAADGFDFFARQSERENAVVRPDKEII